MVASDAGERSYVLVHPFTVTQRRYFVGVSDALLAELAHIYGAGSHLLVIDIPVLVFDCFPFHVFPLELDVLFAMWAGDVVLALVAAEISLPNASF